jgi:large subunit ribosomal protein LP2
MKYIAAYLLLVQAGKSSPSAADITKVIKAAGFDADGDRIKSLLSSVEGKSVEELLAEGQKKMSGGFGGGAAAPAAAAGGAAPAAKKEEKVVEEEEEEGDMGFGLFG